MTIVTPFSRAWQHRELIRAILARELGARFRGSVLGWVWAIAAPLVMMTAYTVAFSGVINVATRVPPSNHDIGSRALVIFSGMILFNFFVELINRAPSLLYEHAGFIKKSIFPTDMLAWIAVLRALAYAAISFGILLIFQMATVGRLPWTVILAPIVIVPFLLLLLGCVWFLMALGAFTRDVVHLVAALVPLLMFITPVFYGLSEVPQGLRHWIRLNIVGDYIDMFRGVELFGQLPPLATYVACFGASFVVFFFGYLFFSQYKSILVDVI